MTCVYGLPDPNYAGRLSFMDVLDALDAMTKPTILVIQQKWPPELMAKAGLAGEMMVTSMKAVGCVGMLSNGPSRDVDAIRKLGFQLLLGGVTAGHGEMAVQSVNVPVSVGGMDVAPGEIIHMDENGAVKFPPKHAPAIVKNARAMLDDEARAAGAAAQGEDGGRGAGGLVGRRLHAEEGVERGAHVRAPIPPRSRPVALGPGGEAVRDPDPAGGGRRPGHRRAGLHPRPRCAASRRSTTSSRRRAKPRRARSRPISARIRTELTLLAASKMVVDATRGFRDAFDELDRSRSADRYPPAASATGTTGITCR